MFANFINRKLERITIVDKNPMMLSKWRDLLRRGNINKQAQWMYYETFEEFVDTL